MSYLQLTSGIPDFTQAVISFWFRVPQSSFDAITFPPDAVFDPVNFGWLSPPLAGIIPLITFGSSEDITPSGKTSPSYIGVDRFASDTDAGLVVNLQTPTTATGQTGACVARPDVFFVEAAPDFIYPPSIIKVAPDQWHHVIVSFHLKSCSAHITDFPYLFGIDAYADLWLAFDDENYDGAYLAPSGGWADTGSNGVVTQGTVNLLADMPATSNWDATDILSGSNSAGIPSEVHFVDNIYPVEMAELQFFTGVTLDTSAQANRRIFVDDLGKPVSAEKQATTEDPQSGSIEYLGQRPDILLAESSTNWIAGRNTGPMIPNPAFDPSLPPGPDNPESIIDPDRQFTSTGKIVTFSPDPSLTSDTPPPLPRLRHPARAV